MKRYPLVFGLRDLIQGNGFLAGVDMEERALMHEEDDGYVWIEGINPGGFAGTGSNPAEALESFRREYKAALYDMAEEARDFEAFQGQVRSFFENTGEIPAREWDAAVRDVREGRVAVSWLNRRSADTPCHVRLVSIDQPSADNNRLEDGPALAA